MNWRSLYIAFWISLSAACLCLQSSAQQNTYSANAETELLFVQTEQLMSAGKYEAAIRPCLDAYRLSLAQHNKMSVARASLLLCEAYRQTSQFDDALDFGIRCISMSDGTSFEYAVASRLSLIHLFQAWKATEKELSYIDNLLQFQGLEPELTEQLLAFKIDCLIALGRKDEAIPLIDQFITTSKSEKSELTWLRLTEKMTALQREMGNLSAALSYQFMIINNATIKSNHDEYSLQLNNYGELLAQTGDYKKAIEYFSQALEMAGGENDQKAIVLINRATILYKTSRRQQAIQDLDNASNWSLEHNFNNQHALAEFAKSKIIAAQGDFVSALNAAQTSLLSAEKTSDFNLKKEVHLLLSTLNSKLGATSIAEEHNLISQQIANQQKKLQAENQRKHKALIDEITNQENNIQSAIAASEAENIRLEQQLKIANQEKNLTQLQLEKQTQEAALKDEQVAREKAIKELALIQAALLGEQQKRTITELEQERTAEELKIKTLKHEQNEKQRNLELLKKQNELLNSENRVREIETQSQKRVRNIGLVVLILTVVMLLTAISAFLNSRKKNKVIAANNEEIRQFNNQLRYQNEEITSSILYARNFQDMIIPGEDYLKKLLPESFLIYKPLDNVSGDIPFILQRGNKIYIGAIDCIGHGVPAAMLSFMAYYNLSQLIADKPNFNVGEILVSLHNKLANSLPKSNDNLKFSAGVDIGLCCLNTDTLELQFAGANQPLILVTKEGTERIQGEKWTLGDSFSLKQNSIPVHARKLQQGDRFFLLSDGFIHQFGGEDGKRKYGLKRLLIEVEEYFKLPAEKAKELILENFSSWKKDIPQTDDVMLLGITVGTNKHNNQYNQLTS
jgi:serine phosphatase RsbU (regulator of sigma subunit)